jgi:hypothetical protein
MVCAWEEDFTGYVVDYGSYPEQGRRYFSLADANPTLQSVSRTADSKARSMRGLKD